MVGPSLMPSTSLPLELYHTIMSYLADENEWESLASCSRVSHAFYSISQPLFFRRLTIWCNTLDIHIQKDEDYNRNPSLWHFPAFTKILRRSPHLADYVKNLEIHIMRVSEEHGSLSQKRANDLGAVLSRLNKVSSISFPCSVDDVRQNYAKMINWRSLNHGLKDLMLKTFNMDRIREIDVQNIFEFPVFKLSRTSSLERLSLGSFIWMKSASEMPLTKLEVVTLAIEDHGLKNLCKWLAHPSRVLNRASIRRLEILGAISSRLGKETDSINYIFNVLPNVDHLFIHVDNNVQYGVAVDGSLSPWFSQSPYPAPNLHLLQNLRTVTFDGVFYASAGYGPGGVTYMESCIGEVSPILNTLSLSTSNHIEHIKFIIGIEVKVGSLWAVPIPDYIENPLPFSTWWEIVDILLSPRLPSLQEVEMVVSLPDHLAEKKYSILECIKSHPALLKLQERGLLQ